MQGLRLTRTLRFYLLFLLRNFTALPIVKINCASFAKRQKPKKLQTNKLGMITFLTELRSDVLRGLAIYPNGGIA
jgi:hypothetical protein